MGGFDYVGVPWAEGAEDPQPELRAELEGAGFTLVGGIAHVATDLAAITAMARSYTDEQAEAMIHWAGQPGQVLVSPDRRAFAHLSWFWGCRYAVLTTVLEDGRLVETATDWESDPPWPRRQASSYARSTDRHTEQVVLSMDRDVEVAAGGAGAAWGLHQRRVARLATRVPEHADLEDFVRTYAAASTARGRWASRVRGVASALAVLLAVMTVQLLLVLTTPSSWLIALAVGAIGLAVFLLTYQPIWLRVRRWRWLRPRFRAPVPGAGRPSGRPSS